MNQSVEHIFIALQRLQNEHDKISHQDILSFDLYKKLKHMVLHFYKYAGKMQIASESKNLEDLRRVLIDALIICMASGNALKISLGKSMPANADSLDSLCHLYAQEKHIEDVFTSVTRDFLIIGGKMAKAMESADHMEDGNPRSEMETLVPQLTFSILRHLGKLGDGFESEIRERLSAIEGKSFL